MCSDIEPWFQALKLNAIPFELSNQQPFRMFHTKLEEIIETKVQTQKLLRLIQCV